jgi:hypothetical protein
LSVHGIVYRAFYRADPKKNPTQYSSKRQDSGLPWEIIGPCRRTNEGDSYQSIIEEGKGEGETMLP